ncbi:MAG: hypothetical protein KAR14_02080, partial [Candidatus Aminicenantes bacterium]|nr:hypothetical protein [Candidatus Aminicenantes bacterium]
IADEKKYVLSVTFTDVSDNLFAHSNSLNNSKVFSKEGVVSMKIPNLNFNQGRYNVTLIIYDDKHSIIYSIYKKLFSIKIENNFVGGANILYHDAVWEEGAK